MILKLDFTSDIPIYQQIRNQIVLGVAGGELKAGEKIPTMRALADEAGINFMTVNKAYSLLKQEGVIVTDRRNGARICECALIQREGTEKHSALHDSIYEALRLVIAEAKLAGISRDEFLRLCDREFSASSKPEEANESDRVSEKGD